MMPRSIRRACGFALLALGVGGFLLGVGDLLRRRSSDWPPLASLVVLLIVCGWPALIGANLVLFRREKGPPR